MLEQERQFYDCNLAEWLKLYPGRFVVVKGETLVGVFDGAADALAEGARQFQLQPFLVRKVALTQEEARVPALAIGAPLTNVRA